VKIDNLNQPLKTSHCSGSFNASAFFPANGKFFCLFKNLLQHNLREPHESERETQVQSKHRQNGICVMFA
jgi:hypothetical protein